MTKTSRCHIFILSCAWCLLAATALAQGILPAGPEFQVNSYTTLGQKGIRVDADPNGNFVTVWMSEGSGGTDASGSSIQAQRFAADASPLGGEFQVNSYTTGDQEYPDIASDSDGDFVVVWGMDLTIAAQRFASDGSFRGAELVVNSYTSLGDYYCNVGMNAAGGFIVVWQGWGIAPDPDFSVQGQRFVSDGTKIGGEFQVNNYTTGDAYLWDKGKIAVNSDGDFVVVWSSTVSPGDDSSDYSVQARQFDSGGTPSGPQFQVNASTASYQGEPAVAMRQDGDFVIVWTDYAGLDGDSAAIAGQRFASDGSLVGSALVVNSYTTSRAKWPSVDYAPNDDFVVTYTNVDADTWGVRARRFASDGTPSGEEIQVNEFTTNQQLKSVVAMQSNSELVIAWDSGNNLSSPDGSGSSVQGRRFSPEVFSDGFESGDTTQW